LLLAGDCGEAIAEVAAASNASSQAPSSSTVATDVSCTEVNSGQVVFIDESLEDVEQLVKGLAQGSEFFLIASDQSGLSQMDAVLQTRSNVSSVHIVAHGEAGKIKLGNQIIDLETINRSQSMIQGWANALTTDADILIYGCKTGAGELGEQFVRRVAELRTYPKTLSCPLICGVWRGFRIGSYWGGRCRVDGFDGCGFIELGLGFGKECR
tara:strand:+ start:6705 stop:7337 length:633 start_codon:yes stop_codon:yes gene_type:complete